MVSPEPGDATPIVHPFTEIAPAGRLVFRPFRERAAVDREKIAGRPAFPGLLDRQARFIVATSIFLLIGYFALPALVGYRRDFMETRVGPVNIAYLCALSQFFMAWIVAALYVRAANIFDCDAKVILDDTHQHQKTNQQSAPQYPYDRVPDPH